MQHEHNPKRFVIFRVGTCSICGMSDEESFAYARIPGRSASICAQCLRVFLPSAGKYEADARKERKAMAAQIFRLDPHYEAKRRLRQGFESKDVDEVVAAVRMAGFSMQPAEARDLLERLEGQSSCSIGSRPIGPMQIELDTCSFCDAKQDEVHKLQVGPKAAVCDRCIYDASVTLLGTLQPP